MKYRLACLIVLLAIIFTCNHMQYYHMSGTVTDVIDDTVTVKLENGKVYEYYDTEHCFHTGNDVTAKLWNHGTDSDNADDEIVIMR